MYGYYHQFKITFYYLHNKVVTKGQLISECIFYVLENVITPENLMTFLLSICSYNFII